MPVDHSVDELCIDVCNRVWSVGQNVDSAFDRDLLKAFQREPTSLQRRKSTGKLV